MLLHLETPNSGYQGENIIRQVQSGLADKLILIIENSYHKRLPTQLKMLSKSGIAVIQSYNKRSLINTLLYTVQVESLKVKATPEPSTVSLFR